MPKIPSYIAHVYVLMRNVHVHYVCIIILVPQRHVSRAFVLVWRFAEPLLFALIGAEIGFEFIQPSLIGK